MKSAQAFFLLPERNEGIHEKRLEFNREFGLLAEAAGPLMGKHLSDRLWPCLMMLIFIYFPE
nr:MAG TPA: hypothetical protein [Caudoviricetes sp.]